MMADCRAHHLRFRGYHVCFPEPSGEPLKIRGLQENTYGQRARKSLFDLHTP